MDMLNWSVAEAANCKQTVEEVVIVHEGGVNELFIGAYAFRCNYPKKLVSTAP